VRLARTFSIIDCMVIDKRYSKFILLQDVLVSFSLSSSQQHYYASPHSAAAVQTGESNYPSLWGAHSHLPTGRPFLTYCTVEANKLCG